jgi:hypothetical protein
MCTAGSILLKQSLENCSEDPAITQAYLHVQVSLSVLPHAAAGKLAGRDGHASMQLTACKPKLHAVHPRHLASAPIILCCSVLASTAYVCSMLPAVVRCAACGCVHSTRPGALLTVLTARPPTCPPHQVNNEDAIRFYQKHGFAVQETVPGYYGRKVDSPDAVILSQSLAQPQE